MGSARPAVVVLAVVLTFGMLVSTSSQPSGPEPNLAIERGMAVVTGQATRKPHERLISGGVLASVRRAREAQTGGSLGRDTAPSVGNNATITTGGCSNVFPGTYTNVRVNQDCSFSLQGEEFIVVDPADPTHVVAAANDFRIGDNHCSIAYSFDQGSHWGDLTPPLWGFIARDRHRFDAASDPALAMDSRGNTYFECVVFDVSAAPSGILVTKSNAAFGGSFFHSPFPHPTPGPQAYVTLPLGVVTNDSTRLIFNDKAFIFSDPNPASPKRDRVYVIWTRFRMDAAGNFLESPIFFSQSTNGGATWSPKVEISGASSACVGGNTFDPTIPANECNFDEGSWMVIGPDGTLYVFFNSGNTPTIVAEQLMVKCPAAADCTKQASWTPPVKIADDFATQPFFLGPGSVDPATGCTAGTQCLSPNGYRVNDFGAAGLDPTFGAQGRLYFAWADFRNGGPCASFFGLFPVPPCTNYNNDVFLVWSDDGGATWSPPMLVSGGAGTQAAQWQPWMAVGPDGIVYVAYYDRQYGSCESTGCNDITLAASTDHGNTFQYVQITTGSMPNLTPATTPSEAFGFLGDYMNVQANASGAYIVWADTRPHAGTIPEEDVYFAFFPRAGVALNRGIGGPPQPRLSRALPTHPR